MRIEVNSSHFLACPVLPWPTRWMHQQCLPLYVGLCTAPCTHNSSDSTFLFSYLHSFHTLFYLFIPHISTISPWQLLLFPQLYFLCPSLFPLLALLCRPRTLDRIIPTTHSHRIMLSYSLRLSRSHRYIPHLVLSRDPVGASMTPMLLQKGKETEIGIEGGEVKRTVKWTRRCPQSYR